MCVCVCVPLNVCVSLGVCLSLSVIRCKNDPVNLQRITIKFQFIKKNYLQSTKEFLKENRHIIRYGRSLSKDNQVGYLCP